MSTRSLGLAISLPLPFELYSHASEYTKLVDLARMADDAGARSVIVVDHVVMGNHPEQYQWGTFRFPPDTPWLEPLTLLTAMAAVTRTVRLSTGILIAPLRPAALLAKSVATLDALSGGRVELGVGIGWQREEFEAEGLDFDRRGQLLDDTIGACQALWTTSPTSFTSPSVSFDGIWCEPKPIQPGGPPVLFSGTLIERNIRRIVAMGSGWLPIMTATPAEVEAGVAVLRERLAAAGRDPSDLLVRARLSPVAGADGKPDLDATLEGAAAFAAMGVTDVSVRMTDYVHDHADAGAWFERLGRRWAEART
jgi:probable F420-dependent oxidoreductase